MIQLQAGRQNVEIKFVKRKVRDDGEEYFIVLLENETGGMWDTIFISDTGRLKFFSILQHVAYKYNLQGNWTAQKIEYELRTLVGRKVSVDVIQNERGHYEAIGYKKV